MVSRIIPIGDSDLSRGGQFLHFRISYWALLLSRTISKPELFLSVSFMNVLLPYKEIYALPSSHSVVPGDAFIISVFTLVHF